VITDDRRDQAMRYMAETDSEMAEAEGDTMRREFTLDLIKDRCFLAADGSVAERNAKAGIAPEVGRAHEEWVQALVAFKRIKAKRESERIVWETWRSENSNRRQGG